jgi:hypothetical protein
VAAAKSGVLGIQSDFSGAQDVLLRSIAEQIKLPLMYIARQAEFSRGEETVPRESFDVMHTNADMALRLVDSYILGLDLAKKQMELELEPVPLSALLHDVAHDLVPIAQQHNTDIELVLSGRYGQVMAHNQGLIAALYSLGSVLAEVCSEDKGRGRLRIAAHRSSKGIVAGMYIDGAPSLQTTMYQARKMRTHHTRQPFAQLSSSTGAGIFVADIILASMNARLRAGRYHGKNGLAMTLQPSKQLQLV